MENLSLRVLAGEKVALIGPSGGGKTTLMKLFLRQYDLNGGKIEIDGRDISKFTLRSLHENIAPVPMWVNAGLNFRAGRGKGWRSPVRF